MKPTHALLALPLTIAGLLAQEIRLDDGTVLVGEVERIGDSVRVATLDGSVTVARDRIVRERTRDELLAELDRVAQRFGDEPHAALELASLAKRFGLEVRMWRHLRDALAVEVKGDAAALRLDRFLGSLEPELLSASKRQANPPVRVRALLALVGAERDEKVRAIECVLAGLEDGRAELRKQARSAGSASRRLAALRALARRGDADDTRFVLRTAIVDANANVRRDAMRTRAATVDPEESIGYLSPGLLANQLSIRTRTAEAFANLGHHAAIPVLVHAGIAAGASALPGGATRGYIAVTRQTSYVRDFDVEVAQAAFIADPKIDVVQDGVVLDATLFSVTTRRLQLIRSYRRALELLCDSDPGPEPKDWSQWAARQSTERG
ncbi:MAG: hypothetical protein KDB80_16595 [Planctomycetes bacterium]|nr:hypothetical protein [Planctomycetota bacterium]